MYPEDRNPDNNEESVKDLYDRFRLSIGKDNDDVYFSEEDLVEIYDYADDHFDEFVKMEVLFYGARMFPDSKILQTKRRYLYADLGNTDAVAKLLEQQNDDLSILDKILMFRNDPYADFNDLVKIIDEAKSLEDDEVIELLKVFDEPELYPWLRRNYQKIAQKSCDVENMYFNTLLTAKDNNDTRLVIKLSEELTMLNPFNIEYLELLASTQIEVGQFKQALSTLEYSLALNPKSVRSLILKAEALAGLNPASEEACNILISLKDDEDFTILRGWETLITILLQRDNADTLINILRQKCFSLNDNIVLFETLLVADPEGWTEYKPLLKSKSLPDDPEFWFRRACKHINSNVKIAALLLNEGFSRSHKVSDAFLDLYIEVLYRTGQYADVIKVYRQMKKDASNMPDCVLLYILSLARTGKVKRAVDEAKMVLKNLESDSATNSIAIVEDDDVEKDELRIKFTSATMMRILHTGLEEVYQSIINGLDRPDPLPIDDFDPLINYMEN